MPLQVYVFKWLISMGLAWPASLFSTLEVSSISRKVFNCGNV